jgi:arabinoxylan arabinofuranohydrolase
MPPHLTPNYLFNADPTCRQIGNRFWVFVSHDQCTEQFQGPEDYWHNMMDYRALSTPDLVHWTEHGSLFSIFDARWASGFSVWDGDAGIPAGNRFLAFAPFRDGPFKIGLLAADQPQGPYSDLLGKPFLDTNMLKAAGLTLDRDDVCQSPTVIHDDNGNPHLLFGQFQVFLAPLSPDLTSLVGPPVELPIPKKYGNATEYIEGPMLHRIGKNWVFSYMTYKDRDAPNPTFSPHDPPGPYIRFCTAPSPFGPFSPPRNWIYPLSPDAWNNQHGLAQFNGQWLVAYHVPFNGKQHRRTVLTPITFLPDGTPAPIHPASDPGILPGTPKSLVLDAYATRHAEECHESHLAFEERALKQDFHLKLADGAHLRFRDLDFGPPASSRPSTFHAHVSCENSRITDARLTLHLDSPTAPPLASLNVNFTYWITYYATLSAPIPPLSGVHDLYLKAHGQGGDSKGRLFNLNTFRFTPTPTPSPNPNPSRPVTMPSPP